MTIVACALLLATPPIARADTLALINTLRTAGCEHPLSSAHKIRADAALDAVARDVMKGRRVRDALARADVRASRTAIIQIGGRIDDRVLTRSLGNAHCGSITDPELTAIGVMRTMERLVLVLAAPIARSELGDPGTVSREVLQLVNEARAKPRRCGATRFAAVPPLALNERLQAAAARHARDLAESGRLSHEGSDDSAPVDRVARSGYAWRAVAENVAAGQYSAKQAVESWLSSPGHCANIMGDDFTEMGVGYASNTKKDYGMFWVQVFGDNRVR